jgi:hypothetical protein
MNGHYISFKQKNDEENELLRVFPVELRRQYMPESTDRTTEISGFQCGVMQMSYSTTECIVLLRTKNGPEILSDAISVILDEHDIVKATFMPSNVTIDVQVDDTEHLKKVIYFLYLYPDITNTNKYGRHNLIDLDRTMPDTVPARPRGARRIPEVTAIPMDGTNAVM